MRWENPGFSPVERSTNWRDKITWLTSFLMAFKRRFTFVKGKGPRKMTACLFRLTIGSVPAFLEVHLYWIWVFFFGTCRNMHGHAVFLVCSLILVPRFLQDRGDDFSIFFSTWFGRMGYQHSLTGGSSHGIPERVWLLQRLGVARTVKGLVRQVTTSWFPVFTPEFCVREIFKLKPLEWFRKKLWKAGP